MSQMNHETPTSPPQTISLRRPSQSTVHTVDSHTSGYNNYSPAFSEVTAYDNSNTFAQASQQVPNRLSSSSHSSSSALSRSSSTRQLEAFGNKFLNAITESVRSPSGATGLSRTKSFHARARSLASFVTSSSASEQESRTLSAFGPLFGGASSRRPSTAARIEEGPEEDYDTTPIMDYTPTLTGGLVRSSQHYHSSEQPVRPSQPSRQSTGSTFSRKFNWFGGSKQQSAAASLVEDRSVDPAIADILQPASTLLFPHGTPESQDPGSLGELLRNAETLITRLQTAYRQQESELKIARQEKEAAIEEAEEAETRARHLKLQLDDMGKRATEQEAEIKAMTDELDLERVKRVEQNDQWESRMQARAARDEEPTPKRRSYRDSAGSSTSMSSPSLASDSGFESDCYAETEVDTLASRPMTPLYEQQRWDMPVKQAARPVSRGSLADRTCHVDVGVWTWMREEKVRLERRVRELEVVVDGCLDLVSHA